jgi:hypothetical protein
MPHPPPVAIDLLDPVLDVAQGLSALQLPLRRSQIGAGWCGAGGRPVAAAGVVKRDEMAQPA